MVEDTFCTSLNIYQNTQKWENISQELLKGKITQTLSCATSMMN